MAPISPGNPAGPPPKAKKPTATTKTFRFEPFTKRIARLKIDPVHRLEKYRVVDEDDGLSGSHFRVAFEHWSDLNQSEVYRQFSRQVGRKCESLPQLLYHADAIYEQLIISIGKRDENALEPLLNLVEAFAHDLGEKFEKYFAEVVTLALQIAASHGAADVIEWCFKCVTWIFRFLSRLLVPDLRPVFTIMLPYLGAEKQKHYITRFAAESLSFLLRKAAAKSSNQPEYLTTALEFLLRESRIRSQQDGGNAAFQVGLITLFSEAAMGIDGGVHSSGPALISNTMQCVRGDEDIFESGLDILEGTITSLIHQTGADGFKPVFDVIEDAAMQNPDISDLEGRLFGRLVRVMVGTRLGTRILDWSKPAKLVLHLNLNGINTFSRWQSQLTENMATIAMIIQYAPMDQLLPQAQLLLQSAKATSNPSQFLSFCDMLAKLGRERYNNLLLPYFQTYVLSQWEMDETGLLLLLRNLHNYGHVDYNAQKSWISCPAAWESKIFQLCRQCAGSSNDDFDVRIDGYMQILDVVKFPKNEIAQQELATILHQLVEYGLRNKDTHINMKVRFALGRGFQTYLRLVQPSSKMDSSFWNLICTMPAQAFGLQPFLHGLRWYSKQTLPSRPLAAYEKGHLRHCLLRNLFTDLTSLKLLSVHLMTDIFANDDEWIGLAAQLMVNILETPYNLKNEREIIAQLREIPRLQNKRHNGEIWSRLLPTFCMGLISHFHATPLQELCLAIGEMCSEHEVEEYVFDTCIKWLQTVGVPPIPVKEVESIAPEVKYPSFQCSNLISVDFTMEQTLEAYSKAEDLLAQAFVTDHSVHSVQIPISSRHLALQLLLSVPRLAEKKSRLLSPIFLTAHATQRQSSVAQDADASVSSHTLSPELSEQAWSYQDRKLFLELFGKFLNPRVLYRSAELYETVLDLLTNGSSEIQKAALKAVFTWKDFSVLPYEDVLLRLLDGKSDSGELDSLLFPEPEQSSIDANHRVGLMPVLLRLIFGLMINQSKSKGSQEGKRKALLRKLFNLADDEIVLFLKISFGPLASISDVKSLEKEAFPVDLDVISTDQQYGFLRTMQTIMDVLKTQIAPFGDRILPPVLYCLTRSCHQINEIMCQQDDHPRQVTPSLLRSIRRTGLECLSMLFEYCDELNWISSIPVVFAEVIQPRLSTLSVDTAQGVSGLLKLFSVWSKSGKTLSILQQDANIMSSVVSCIAVPSAKDEVKLFVLNNIVLNVAKLAEADTKFTKEATSMIRSNIELLLANLNFLVLDGPSQSILEAIVVILPKLAPFATKSSEAQALLSSLATLLSKHHKLNPRIKGALLKAIQSLLQDHYETIGSGSLNQIYDLNCSLFNYFKDHTNRMTICDILRIFAQFDEELRDVHKICLDLNSHGAHEQTAKENNLASEPVSTKHTRLDEFQYDHQIASFTAINQLEIGAMNLRKWQPILHNLLFFVKTEQEFSIRSNAVGSLKNFIIRASREQCVAFDAIMKDTLMPAFEKGLKETSETVRADFVSLLGVIVQHLHNAPDLQDMRILLVGGDTEASFYDNILHIQQHRRLRAIRRLVSEAERGAILGASLHKYFLPLLERFVFDGGDDENALTLKGQAIVAISSLLNWVEWPNFRATFRRYRGLMDSKVLKEKDAMKLLNGAIDALSSSRVQSRLEAQDLSSVCPLASTMPSDDTIANELKSNFIPKLTEYIKHNDEARASLRLPASTVAIKAILMLSNDEASFLIPSVLLDICNILRSRDQQIRDEARNTLADVSLLLGPQYLHLVVKELRTALNRGYQIHVLTYTMHKIVITMVPELKPGDLDYCLRDLMTLLIDDIFGSAGLDKDNDDYVSSMKEVKGNKKNSKSFGIIEALAGVTSVKKVSALLEPLRVLFTGTLSSKQQQHAEEVLRRIGVGLIQNPASGSRDILLLSYELISDLYKEKEIVTSQIATSDEHNRKRYLIQASSNHKISSGVNSPGLYKIHRFALDLVRSNLQRHQSLLTVENLHGFLPIIGDAIIGQQEDVKTAGFRLLSAIVKLPMEEFGDNVAMYIKEAVHVVENASNSNAEGPQAAFKLVSSVLREKPAVEVRRRDLEYLLHSVVADLGEPDRQSASFNLIKAVMSREIKNQTFELPEMYEMADKISIMMVSNHSQSARDIARGVYVHFLLEYPQTKKRWEKQLKFLAENLEYQYLEGRQSVMEAINVLVTKLSPERAQEPISWFFLPIVLRLANDENQKCCEMAGALLAQLFSKANQTEMEKMLRSMRGWIEQTKELTLTITGMQAYGHFLQAVGPLDEAPHVRTSIENILLVDDSSMIVDGEVTLRALELFSKLVTAAPAVAMTKKQAHLWSAIWAMLKNSDVETQSTSANLVTTLLQDILVANSKPDLKLGKLPLTGSYGLQIDQANLIVLLKSSLGVLRHLNGASTTLEAATVRNLLFLARCFDANNASIDIGGETNAQSDSDTDPLEETARKTKMPAIQYLLHQLSAILRRESDDFTSAALASKTFTLQLLSALLPILSPPALTTDPRTLITLLKPLRHLTSADLVPPKSAEPAFHDTYAALIASAHDVMEALRTAVGDGDYVKAMTQVGREVRDRREERRQKRRITAVLDPERAAGKKVKKNERKTARRKEVAGVQRTRRTLV